MANIAKESMQGALKPVKERARRFGIWAAKWGSAAVAAKAGFEGKFDTALWNGTTGSIHELKWSALTEPIQHAVTANPWLLVLSLAGVSATVLASQIQKRA